MAGFAHALGHVLKTGFDLTETGQRYNQSKLKEQQQNNALDQADEEFANHMMQTGARPVINGAVKRDLTSDDGTTVPNALVDKADPGRVITHKLRNGQKVQYEIATPEEQIGRQALLLHQQFTDPNAVSTREGQRGEAAATAGANAEATAAGTARAGAAARESRLATEGVDVPSSLDSIFPGISQIPGTPATPASSEQITPGISLETNAQPGTPAKPRKLLPAELGSLTTAAEGAANVKSQVDQRAMTKAVQQLSSADDQASYDAVRQANPDATASWPSIFHPAIKASLLRQNVPVEKQPEYDIQNLTRQAMDSMTHDPATVDAEIDKIIPPAGDTKALNDRTKTSVRLAISQGDLKGARALIKDASDKLSDEEKAVIVAKNTAGTKIYVAGAEAAAKNAANVASSGLTEDDLAREGRQLAITGQSAQLGNGSGPVKAKILHYKNQFARDSGLTPKDMATAAAAYKGDSKSLAAMIASRDQIGSFEQTAQKNLDQFLDLAGKIPDTGVPWLNTPIRDLDEKVVGSANMAAVNAAREVANNEIAKVTSGGGLGGVLSDAARNEVKSYNPASATFAQTKAVAAVLKKDMANRMQSFDTTIGDIQNRIANPGGAQIPPAGGAPAAAAAPPAAGKVTKTLGQTVTLKDGRVGKVSSLHADGTYDLVDPKTGVALAPIAAK